MNTACSLTDMLFDLLSPTGPYCETHKLSERAHCSRARRKRIHVACNLDRPDYKASINGQSQRHIVHRFARGHFSPPSVRVCISFRVDQASINIPELIVTAIADHFYGPTMQDVSFNRGGKRHGPLSQVSRQDRLILAIVPAVLRKRSDLNRVVLRDRLFLHLGVPLFDSSVKAAIRFAALTPRRC
ncbi:hypothetical protein ACVWXM_009665 [Bradyrhizobium sp. GM7.3]